MCAGDTTTGMMASTHDVKYIMPRQLRRHHRDTHIAHRPHHATGESGTAGAVPPVCDGLAHADACLKCPQQQIFGQATLVCSTSSSDSMVETEAALVTL